MQFVASTPLAMLLCAAILWLGPVRGVWLLFLTMPLGSSAAFNLAGLGTITLTDAAVLSMCLSLLVHRVRLASVLGTLTPGQPGFALILTLLVATLGAVFLPRIFAGDTEVFVIGRQGRAAELMLNPLGPVSSNPGQVFRLTISVAAFVLLATVFRRSGDSRAVLRAVVAASLLHVAVSLADLASGVLGRDPLAMLRTGFVNVLDNQVILGMRRLIGAFSEPSSYAYYTVGLFGFWLRYWFGARSAGAAAMLLVVIVLLARSTSSAAWLTATAFLALFAVLQIHRVGRNPRAALLYVSLVCLVPAAAATIALAYSFVPLVSGLLDQLVFGKLETRSGVERMTWNLQALRNFAETYGLGAGMGSLRGSGWLFVTLGSLGTLGTGLYLWFLYSVFLARPAGVAAGGHQALVAASLQSGCAAILLQACLTKPYPNLETPFFAMAGLAVGLLRYLALNAGARAQMPDPGPPVWRGEVGAVR